MTVNYTSLLSLGQPVTGTESGTWGDDVNNAVTSYLDIAVAGSLALTSANFTAGALTLANTQGTSSATNIGSTTAQYAILRVSSLAVNSTITAPSASKTYLVINADSTYTVTVKASGQTGVTVGAGKRAFIAFNGTDYALVATEDASKLSGTLGVSNGGTGQTTYTNGQLLIGNTTGNTLTKSTLTAGSGVSITNGAGSITISATGSGGSVTSVAVSGGTTGLTTSGGPITTSGTITLAGTLDVDNGGTGQTSYTNGQLLIGNSTGNTLTKATLTAGSGISITNGAGSITIAATGGGSGTVTSVGQTFTGGLISVSGSPVTTSGTLALTVAGTSGGIPYFSGSSTWASSGVLAANALMVGGGAGAAPSTVTTGTGVVTALAVNVGSSGAFVTNGGALGTPSSGTVTNLTGTASININGTVGATTPTTGAFTTVSANGNVTISGSARRILGDFTNATYSNRTIFQTSTTNEATGVFACPNGTGGSSEFAVFGSSDVDNSSFLYMSCSSTSSTTNIVSTKVGTGAYLPLSFYVNGSESMRIATSGEVFIAGTTDQGAYNLQVAGTGVWGAGAYVNGSDARIKENVAPITSGLDVVAKLNPVQFKYKQSWSKDNSIQPGFIAQELQTALAGKDYVNGVVQQGPKYMSVAYQTLIPILTKAIQEQQAQIDQLKAEVAALKGN